MAKIRLGPSSSSVVVNPPVVASEAMIFEAPQFEVLKEQDIIEEITVFLNKSVKETADRLLEVEKKYTSQIISLNDKIDDVSGKSLVLVKKANDLEIKCDVIEKIAKEQKVIQPVETKVLNLVKTDNVELEKVHKDVLSHIDNINLKIAHDISNICYKYDGQIQEINDKISNQKIINWLMGLVSLVLIIKNLL